VPPRPQSCGPGQLPVYLRGFPQCVGGQRQQRQL